jgi:hypothetical protein
VVFTSLCWRGFFTLKSCVPCCDFFSFFVIAYRFYNIFHALAHAIKFVSSEILQDIRLDLLLARTPDKAKAGHTLTVSPPLGSSFLFLFVLGKFVIKLYFNPVGLFKILVW